MLAWEIERNRYIFILIHHRPRSVGSTCKSNLHDRHFSTEVEGAVKVKALHTRTQNEPQFRALQGRATF